MPANITHKALCTAAASWLKRPLSRSGPGCIVAWSETSPMGADEICDALGFTGLIASTPAASVIVEAKVSRADFLADRNKAFRQRPEAGIGEFRYFITPDGLVQPHELPEKWGLIEFNGRRLRVVQGHVLQKLEQGPDGKYRRNRDRWRFSRNQTAEIAFLVRMLQRVADPEKTHARIAAAERRAAMLARTLDMRNAHIRKLEAEALARTLATFAVDQ